MAATQAVHENRLAQEKSPYLLQHAHNPVDWWPWCDEAFDRAKSENKPIFLSIGYSTCHWCHVMEKESFEDEEVARLMNDAFVSIKVDREERPEVDGLYMSVCQAINGSGGWPLTIIMTPDKLPFFAGTYMPKTSKLGQPGLEELTQRVKQLWAKNKAGLVANAEQITEALREMEEELASRGGDVNEQPLVSAVQHYERTFDKECGGFGFAPKFPTASPLLFLLRRAVARATPSYPAELRQAALHMVSVSLERMRAGGVYDYVGFGFHRYATDREWVVPHFEKMLYDQALLLWVYTEGFQVAQNTQYSQTAVEIVTYVQRDLMHSQSGAFFSAEDADSEGVEGKFYVWTAQELQDLLGADTEIFMSAHHCTIAGNFEHRANILYTAHQGHLDTVAKRYSLSGEELNSKLSRCRDILFERRCHRVRPHRDEKVLTDWNALMIGALSKASRVLNRRDFADVAARAANFLITTMVKQQEPIRLMHRYMRGEAGVAGFLDDYAFFSWALCELYMATFNDAFLRVSYSLAKEMVKLFWDDSNGGFYFTSVEEPVLVLRRKEIADGAVPAGNSMALLAMLNLAYITGDTDLEERAHKTVASMYGALAKAPAGFAQMLVGLDLLLSPRSLVVASAPNAQAALAGLDPLWQRALLPHTVVAHNSGAGVLSSTIEGVPKQDRCTFYVCSGGSCKPPTENVEEVARLLLGAS
eukprot:TRINITY_DN4115_c0_g1_i2.p1 TRINITY_DN4115_c0_g1~~TRINITY_DN4115_c0_g1_i2.p1  ORF type:complete len:702 (-),score=160.86 TRINITY_DN4115_c0_g1_i2:79-2184(-)